MRRDFMFVIIGVLLMVQVVLVGFGFSRGAEFLTSRDESFAQSHAALEKANLSPDGSAGKQYYLDWVSTYDYEAGLWSDYATKGFVTGGLFVLLIIATLSGFVMLSLRLGEPRLIPRGQDESTNSILPTTSLDI